ncbi:hypothetical protein E8E13_010385 [Curvularia kusanoi]|uniref:Methyltransferase domain-containing protein n=1 Tax=Curvularia kusanoi TaxID=90978 RepID=A0A9P4TFC8_CURKU|nr:hypothetical protein E8E13_010385 [Curvularia kusanoi]
MATASQVKTEYTKVAEAYEDFGSLPVGLLESQLIKKALGDVNGLVVLDLGGGSGIHARDAINAGAERVDIVDISPQMMKLAMEKEKVLGREDRIRVLEADVSKPLDHLKLGTYDVVMANWVFDHAGNLEMLEGMWRNVNQHLKPGGKFVSIRAGDPRGPALQGKYGMRFKDVKDVPGGATYTVQVPNEPPWDFEAASMEISFSGSFSMHEKYGLTNLCHVAYSSAHAVQSDPEFWKLFIEHPAFFVDLGYKANSMSA